MKRSFSLLLAGASLLSAVLAGCGGGGSISKSLTSKTPTIAGAAQGGSSAAMVSRKGKGQTTVTVKWPARIAASSSGGKSALRTRLIPSATNSIKVALTSGSTAVASTILTRPTSGDPLVSSYTFANLAPATLTATATAYPNADATGNAQAASAVSTLTIVDSQDAPLTLTMDSTVASIVVSGTAAAHIGAATTLTATALDAQGSVVLVGATLVFSSSAAGVASVDPATGVVTGVAAGTATITATYTEGGTAVLSGTLPVTITAAGSIYVTDIGNNRVQKFDSSGSYVSQFGTRGTGNGQLRSPFGIAFH